jgi:hypothetical protein
MQSNRFVRAIIALVGLGSVAVSLEANASALGKSCVVSGVAYDQSTGGRVRLSCNDGTAFYGSTAACGTVPSFSVDTLKTWVSLGQAAFLSGKRLSITYETTSASKCVYSVELF